MADESHFKKINFQMGEDMHSSKLAMTACVAAVFSLTVLPSHAVRNGPQGHAEKSVGPNQGGKVSADRTIKGPNASSSFSAAGPRGKSMTGSATSTVAGGKASGQATVSTSGGRSATAQGTGSIKGNTATGSGSVQTGKGYGATGTGSVTKTDSGVNASGTATTNSGKTVSGSVNGNKDGGTVTVEGTKGEKSVTYGNQR